MSDEFIPVPEPAKRAAPSLDATVRTAITWLVVVVLAGAVITAFVSILEIIEIWFDYQYVPIARAVLAITVAAVALYVVRILTRKQAMAPR